MSTAALMRVDTLPPSALGRLEFRVRSLGWAPVLLVAAILGPLAIWVRLQFDDVALGDAWVGDVGLQPRASLRERLREHAARWNGAMFTVYAGPALVRSTRAELGAHLDGDEAYALASQLGRSGNPLRDLAAYAASLQHELRLPWRPRVRREQLMRAFAAMREQVERAPAGTVQGEDGRLLPGIAGQTLNSVEAMARIEHALREGAEYVRLPVVAIAPAGPATQLMYAAETLYPKGRGGRARNIELAAATLDGTRIATGEEFSFNQRVGERSFERGFARAKELANRRVVDGIGGGVCQVAATLHAAVFLSGMDITRYSPHSRPVRYIPLGLDTMVSWPHSDLRFRNPYPFPVELRARASDGLVRLEVRGSSRPYPVQWSTRILERISGGATSVVKPELHRGQTVVLQEAIDGLLVERTRTRFLPSGPTTETLKLRYPPTPRIVARGLEASSD